MKPLAGALLAVALAVVSPALPGQVTLRTVSGEKDLPEAFAPEWKAGDLLLADGRYLVLIGGSPRPLRSLLNSPVADGRGGILSFVPAGSGLAARLNIGGPVVRRGRRTDYPGYSGIKALPVGAAGGGLALEAVAPYAGQGGEKASIRTVYAVRPGSGRIDIVSTLTNTGSVAIDDLGYSLISGTSSAYAFAPYSDAGRPGQGFRVVQKQGLCIGWLDPNPKPKDGLRLPGSLSPGESYEIRYGLLVDSSLKGLLGRIYEALGIACHPVRIGTKGFGGVFKEIIVREAVSDAVFYRSFSNDPAAVDVPLPAGTYKVTANLFPAVVEAFLAVGGNDGPGECVLEAPPMGTLKLRLEDARGNPVPGKATVFGLSPTPSPYFSPDNPVETGRSWERAKNSCYPGPEGAEIRLAAGNYLISASFGPEFTVDQKVVEVLAEGSGEYAFRLEKKIDSSGYVSVDTHLHTTASDGRTGIPERLRSIAAEGVDCAIAADHNVVTDYGPWLKELGLDSRLTVIRGTEVTPEDFYIHFNVFPFPEKFVAGAVGPAIALDGGVAEMFARTRKALPKALIQVNHPRLDDLGYFKNARLDPDTAGAADANFSTDFDLLEVMNGPIPFTANDEAVGDWLHLLNRGRFYPITGSSDSHSADGGEPGFSRVYVRYAGGKGARLDWDSLAGAMKAGRSFVSNGPFVSFEVDGRWTSGDLVTHGPGTIGVRARVQAAPWVAVDEIRIIVNGERRIVRPVRTGRASAVRFDQVIPVSLDRDSTIVVEVLGMEALFPVARAEEGGPDRTRAALPYALTNPVFVDVDGNGRFDAPLPGTIGVLPAEPRKR